MARRVTADRGEPLHVHPSTGGNAPPPRRSASTVVRYGMTQPAGGTRKSRIDAVSGPEASPVTNMAATFGVPSKATYPRNVTCGGVVPDEGHSFCGGSNGRNGQAVS